MGDPAPPMSSAQRWAVVGIVAWAIVFTFVSGLMLVQIAVAGSLLVPSFVAFVVLLAAPSVYLLRRKRRASAP
jgi:hypothetical protein